VELLFAVTLKSAAQAAVERSSFFNFGSTAMLRPLTRNVSSPWSFKRRIVAVGAAGAGIEAALEEGLAPLMGWVKRLVDNVIQNRMGHTDLEFAWSEVRPTDPKDQSAILSGYVKDGIYTLNEARGLLGLDPIEGGDEPMFLTAQGPVLLREALALKTVPHTTTAQVPVPV
jgi:hypothetical protein